MNEPKQLVFCGIDEWSRPIFKDVACKSFYGATDVLFESNDTEEDVLAKVNESDITWFGNTLGCEPMGSRAGNIKIVRKGE